MKPDLTAIQITIVPRLRWEHGALPPIYPASNNHNLPVCRWTDTNPDLRGFNGVALREAPSARKSLAEIAMEGEFSKPPLIPL